ncbi:hypothetical protein MMC11_001271 [Xylographa trunciseda]|nr:hypothetical protein [Xylographa trunciseda]
MIALHRLSSLFISLLPFLSALPVLQPAITGPAITSNFPDPAVIIVGSTFYAFATGSSGLNIPMATSSDGKTWNITDTDALPKVGAWSNGQNVWAPDVVQLSSGKFVLYYAATSAANTSSHCVGAATSDSVTGPYTPIAKPIACPASQGGAIDAAGFADYDGSQYVVYKIDGNNIGNGGNCNNGNAPIVPTPIMLQQVSPSNGYSLIGSPIQILDRDDADGPLVEAPSLVRVQDSSAVGGWMYVLFFSSNCYSSNEYDTSYAISTNGIFNGGADYAKSSAPLLLTGSDNNQLYSPGGLDIDVDGVHVVFHADLGKSVATRQMWDGIVKVDTASEITQCANGPTAKQSATNSGRCVVPNPGTDGTAKSGSAIPSTLRENFILIGEMEGQGKRRGFETAEFEEWLNLDGALKALSPSQSPNFHFSSASAGSSSPLGLSQPYFDFGTESSAAVPSTEGVRKRKASQANGEGNGNTIKSKGKKTSHNVIEKRYRSNLNDKIAILRDSVPALRISAQRAPAKDGSSDTEDSGEGEGPTSKVKLNKATVLTKATDYIKQLERQNERLMEENAMLRNRLNGAAHSPPDSTIAVSYEPIKQSNSPITDATSSPPKTEVVEDSSASTVAPVGMIKVPDDIARLRIGASEEHYAPDVDFSMGTRGRYMSRLLLGSLATLMVMEGLSEVESDRSNEPGSRGLFALPSELLRESRGFRDPIRRRIIAFAYSIQPHQTTSLLKLCFISIILFLVIISTLELGRKSLRKSKLSSLAELEPVSSTSTATQNEDRSVSMVVAPVLGGTEMEAEDLSVTMIIRGFFARQALAVLDRCSWLQTNSKDEEAASLPSIRAEDFRRRWRAYAELLPKLLEESHAR